jgi:glycosyltransferase involved in cell wall biosynthesis
MTADMKFTICSAVNDEDVLRSCLLSSPDISGAGEIMLPRGCLSAATAYNAALTGAKHDIVILIHQDIYLPRGWFERLESAIHTLEATDPQWGVLGVYGITPGGVYHGHLYCNASQTLLGRPLREPAEVGSLDEIVLVVRKGSGLRFDPEMKGFHFYAADICLTARQRGLKNYAVPAFCFHNANGYGMFPRSFWQGYFYIWRKWRALLPVRTPCIEINRSLWPVLRGTIWRYCWLKKSSRPLARRVQNPAAVCASVIARLPQDSSKRLVTCDSEQKTT